MSCRSRVVRIRIGLTIRKPTWSHVRMNVFLESQEVLCAVLAGDWPQLLPFNSKAT